MTPLRGIGLVGVLILGAFIAMVCWGYVIERRRDVFGNEKED